MVDKDDDLFTSNAVFSKQLSNDIPLVDNSSKLCTNDFPDKPIIPNTTDVSLVANSHNVDSIDR